MSLKLFADSGSDLPLAFYKENSITLIPLQVHLNDESYLDMENISPEVVYEAIRNGSLPKTSQPTPEYFHNIFSQLVDSGESGLYICFSSELSGTYQNAVMVQNQLKEEHPDFDLTIIDSKCASLGLGLVIQRAVEMINKGLAKEKIIQEVQWLCEHMEHIFTVEDLNYLAAGGRLSRTSAFLGGMLNIKPILHVEKGKLVPLEKVRSKKKLLRRILEIMEERGVDLDNQTIGISHGDDELLALEMKQLIEERFGTKKFFINIIGSVIGAHAGPGTLAVFFLNDKKADE